MLFIPFNFGFTHKYYLTLINYCYLYESIFDIISHGINRSDIIINKMSLAGKKVICVGGNGYIGNYFVARLIQAQAQVQILCRLLSLIISGVDLNISTLKMNKLTGLLEVSSTPESSNSNSTMQILSFTPLEHSLIPPSWENKNLEDLDLTNP